MLGWSLLGGLSELAWRRVRTADALSRRKHLAYDCCWEVAARAKYSGRRETVTVRGITYTEFQGFPDLPGVVWCARVLSGCKSTTGATLLFGCWVSALPLPSKLSELRYTSNTSILQCRTLVHLKMGRIINTCKHLNVLRFLGCGAWVDLGRESHEFHLVQVAPNRLAQSLVFCYFHNGVMGDGVQSKMSGRLSLKKKKNKKPTIRVSARRIMHERCKMLRVRLKPLTVSPSLDWLVRHLSTLCAGSSHSNSSTSYVVPSRYARRRTGYNRDPDQNKSLLTVLSALPYLH
eukprot:9394672-Pyramimonas_sp.AAC.1